MQKCSENERRPTSLHSARGGWPVLESAALGFELKPLTARLYLSGVQCALVWDSARPGGKESVRGNHVEI